MRITRFELAAFGPFTGKVLEFPRNRVDLHVIYGANEAGKSSCLRALRAWLFGFPERTRDDFIHPRTSLLVGGELSREGQHLEFYRRKKRKGDIVDRDGSPLDPSLLDPFLGGLDVALFESLYAIDHDTLVQGGREILARKGELGETLFSAGAGLGSLHQALERMEAEKAQLYKVRGKNQKINQRIRLHKSLHREIRELSCEPEAWQRQADALERLSRELDEMQKKRRQLDRRRVHCERLFRAAPLLARRKAIRHQLRDLGDVRSLPPDFGKRRAGLQQRLRSERQRLDLLRARRELIKAELDRLSPQATVVSRSAQIESLYQRLGAYKKAREDRPHREGMRSVLRKEAARLLQTVMPDFDLDDFRILAPLLRQKKKILSLATEHGALARSRRDAELRLSALREELDQTLLELSALPQPVSEARLQAAVDRALKEGNIDQRIESLHQELRAADKSLLTAIQRLGHWQKGVDSLPNAQLVPMAAVRRFDGARQELVRQEQQLAAQAEEIRDELLHGKTRMRELALGGEVVTEKELIRIRKKRDEGWHLLCKQWLQGEDIGSAVRDFAPEGELHEVVFSLIQQADQVGDRLRLEADRVQTFVSLQAREEELAQRSRDNKQARKELAAALEEYRQSWRKLWQPLGIIPAAPDEMADWLAAMEKLQQQAASLALRRDELARMHQARAELRQAVADNLAVHGEEIPEGESLEPVLAAARSLLTEMEQARRRHEQTRLEAKQQRLQVRQAERELEQLTGEQQEWQRRWRQLMVLGDRELPLGPDEVQDFFDTVADIDTRLKEAATLAIRIQGMDRDCAEFEREVTTLVAEVAPELKGNGVEQIAGGLYDLMTIAGREQALHDQLSKELRTNTGEIAESELVLQDSRQELDTLLELAGCTEEEELIRAEQKSEEHARLAKQVHQVEQDLQQIAGELSLAELETEVGKVDIDALPGEIHALEEEISREIDPALQRLAEQKGEVRKMLEQMDGSGRAARKAEELQDNLAHLRRDAQRYLRLQVGVDLLRREIEKFRRKNQGPVLTRASGIFAELTLGSFSGLKPDVDSRGEPVLVGVRPDSPLPIDVTAMSTGSRDQLYLALRLASLVHRAEQGRPMVSVFDDILINFDDERSTATLKVLAGLEGENQLILFTHQRHVARQAEQIDGVQVHYLEQ